MFRLVPSVLSAVLLACCILGGVGGCASFGEKSTRIRQNFAQGRLDEAQAEIDKQLKKRRQRETNLLKLNQSIIELCSGRPKESEQLLRTVRDNFDRIENDRLGAAGEKTLSMLVDDNSVAYDGEDYEKVLIRVFLALSNLMYDGTDAPAYALQIGQKQNEIIRQGATKKGSESGQDEKEINLKASYRQVAIGPYLIGAMREETRQNYDDAVRAYEAVCAWEPSFNQGRQDLIRAQHGVPSAAGNGVVYVFGLVGEGPYKLQRNCEITQDVLFWTSFFLSFVGKHSVTSGIAPVMVPVVVRPQTPVSSLAVQVDGRSCGHTETLTDIGRMAEEQFEAVYPQIVARAVLRRALKKGILYGTKEATGANSWAGLAMDLGGIVWEALETADTRCWNLLPAEIQVLRIELPAGIHTISLQASSRVYSLSDRVYRLTQDTVPIGNKYDKTIRVESGRNTYLLANFQSNTLTGKIVASNDIDAKSDGEPLAP